MEGKFSRHLECGDAGGALVGAADQDLFHLPAMITEGGPFRIVALDEPVVLAEHEDDDVLEFGAAGRHFVSMNHGLARVVALPDPHVAGRDGENVGLASDIAVLELFETGNQG